jgi:hypothetical protein
MKIWLFGLATWVMLSLVACQQTSAPVTDAAVQELKLKHYGPALFSLNPDQLARGLDSLSLEFRIFTGERPDSSQVWQIHQFITDPFNRELAKSCAERFPNGAFPEKDLSRLLGAVKQLNPEFTYPEIYTYVSGLLYELPVYYQDSVMVIALDMFLGSDFEPYQAAGIPRYVTRRMEAENIVPECARQIAYSWLPAEDSPKTLLDHMILHGKVLYALDLFLPALPDSLKINYTKAQLDWCKKNEASLWRLFIDQEMLYKGDAHILSKFMQDGPFTAGLPEGAPAMTGKYMGWQIVRAYMKKNSSSLLELFSLKDAQQILSQSGYKPKL